MFFVKTCTLYLYVKGGKEVGRARALPDIWFVRQSRCFSRDAGVAYGTATATYKYVNIINERTSERMPTSCKIN